jgi:hypothetical protein
MRVGAKGAREAGAETEQAQIEMWPPHGRVQAWKTKQRGRKEGAAACIRAGVRMFGRWSDRLG